jgi:xanthine dehydrogenase YagS FAD-binding subunit
MPEDFQFIRARSLGEAISHLASGGATLQASGIDLPAGPEDRLFAVRKIVNINGLDELRGITPLREGGLRIGALTTMRQVAEHTLVGSHYGAVVEAARSVAARPDHLEATLGGNLCQRPQCWYYRADFACARKGGDICLAADGENQLHCLFGGDLCHMVHPSEVAPALVAFGARARIVGPHGMRIVGFDEFFLLPSREIRRENVLGPAEILTDVLLPPPAASMRTLFRVVRAEGVSGAILASVAVVLEVSASVVRRARIVLGAAAPIPWRSVEAELAITGKPLDRQLAIAAAGAAMAEAEPLSENRYKVAVFGDLIAGALTEMAEA